jgi:hypothetical protein
MRNSKPIIDLELGAALRGARLKAKLSLCGLSARADVPRHFLHETEHGLLRRIHMEEYLRRVEKVLPDLARFRAARVSPEPVSAPPKRGYDFRTAISKIKVAAWELEDIATAISTEPETSSAFMALQAALSSIETAIGAIELKHVRSE